MALSKYMTITDLVQNNDLSIVGLTSEDFPDCLMSYDDPSQVKLPESKMDNEFILVSSGTHNGNATLKQIRTSAVLNLWSVVWFADLRRSDSSNSLLESLVRLIRTKPSCEEIGQGNFEFTARFQKRRRTLSEIVDLGVDFSTPNRMALRRWILEIMIPYVHHVESTILHLRGDPESLLPLYRENPNAFLREESRVTPGLVSVTARLKRNLDVDIASPFRGTGMITRSMERGESVTLVLSEANRDPDHFGGNSKSRIVSRRFDTSREGDSSRLYYDATTQTIQSKENTFLLDMARVVVDMFLPSVQGVETSSEKRSQFRKTVVSHIESEEKWVKLHLHAYTLLLGSTLAVLVGIFAQHIIPSARNLADVIVFRTLLYVLHFLRA